ncbi:MAG: heme-binding domain-containing protein [Desulfuromonadaceae bacterium]|nr:heme-binding domain-containing protein [Desulfuromonadaceae bacterium]MDD2856591.1 heme-binding domain-containing protein [Desulfuromonadaceae bacterium]
MRKFLKFSIIGGFAALILIQIIPYGRNHENRAVKAEPLWDSPETRVIAKKACFNCHSNETIWPFYSNIAPASWLVYHDVAEAREKLNFSEWQNGKGAAENPQLIKSMVISGEMPPFQYTMVHPEARLTSEERTKFVEGIIKTFNQK